MLKKSGSHALLSSWQQGFEWQAMGRLVTSNWLPLHVCILMSACVGGTGCLAARGEEQTDHRGGGEEHSRENKCGRPNTFSQKGRDGQIL